MNLTYYLLVFGILAVFGVMVVWALWWAIRGGQFSDFQKGATSIFDPDEPLGTRTDAFPDQQQTVKDQVDGNSRPGDPEKSA